MGVAAGNPTNRKFHANSKVIPQIRDCMEADDIKYDTEDNWNELLRFALQVLFGYVCVPFHRNQRAAIKCLSCLETMFCCLSEAEIFDYIVL